MTHVASTAVTDLDYEPRKRRLLVRFVSGERYAYEGVPQELYADFVAAASKGRFFHDEVRDRFAYRRL